MSERSRSRKIAKDPWRRKLMENLEDVVGPDLGRLVMNRGLDRHVEDASDENVMWTSCVMRELDARLKEEDRIEVLNRCAHVMPEERIAVRRALFQRTNDLEALHRFCQRDFIEQLKKRYDPLPREWLDHIIEQGWGEAGRLEGSSIIATKIPADLPAYFNAEDMKAKRKAYCHCDRIRNVFDAEIIGISPTYCNCGAGFYRYNWERMIGRPVQVRVLRSLLNGDDRCQFEIILPEDLRTDR
jgi:hypothetical protein